MVAKTFESQIDLACEFVNKGGTTENASRQFGVAVSTIRYNLRKLHGINPGRITAHISVPESFADFLRSEYPALPLARAIEVHLENKNRREWRGGK